MAIDERKNKAAGGASILGEIKKFAGKITDAGFAAIWVSTQSAITKATNLLYAKLKALYDAIPLVLGDYVSATKTVSKIAYENGYFYFHGGANILYKSANIDLSESSAQITLENAVIETFSLGQNLNIIAYRDTNDSLHKVNIYNKQWESITSLTLLEAPANTTKIKIVNNDFIIFNESKAYSISDSEHEDVEDYIISIIYSGGSGNNQIQDIDYFDGEYYWSALVYPGGSWRHILSKGNTGEQTQLLEVLNDYSHSGLTVNENGIVWNYGQNGTIKFTTDGENWIEKYISDTPGLDFSESEPNNFFAIGKDVDGNFIAYSKAYIVNLTDTPTTPTEWTFEKTGLAQAESVPFNDIVFTAKGNSYFVDGKYIYAPMEKELKTKDFTIGEVTITVEYYELTAEWLVCMPSQQSNLNSIFAANGKVNFFVMDVENETLKTIRDNTDGYLYIFVGGSYKETTTEKLAI